jgi:hypothetical protein
MDKMALHGERMFLLLFLLTVSTFASDNVWLRYDANDAFSHLALDLSVGEEK